MDRDEGGHMPGYCICKRKPLKWASGEQATLVGDKQRKILHAGAAESVAPVMTAAAPPLLVGPSGSLTADISPQLASPALLARLRPACASPVQPPVQRWSPAIDPPSSIQTNGEVAASLQRNEVCVTCRTRLVVVSADISGF